MQLLDCGDHLLLRLVRGEKIMANLAHLAREKKWGHCSIEGIGAIEAIELGAYELKTHEYTRREFPGAHELISLHGSVGWSEGEPMVHIHLVMSGHDFVAMGGHLFEAAVYATVELVLRPGPEHLERRMDDEIGLKLWSLPTECEGIR